MTQLALVRQTNPSGPLINVSSGGVGMLWKRLAGWAARAASRRALLTLDDAALKDMGISRAQATFEYNKSFWRQ